MREINTEEIVNYLLFLQVLVLWFIISNLLSQIDTLNKELKSKDE
jgi:hypothetical protein